MDGILNIYKKRGFTSHDVVAKLRGILHQKKIGHTGTLDPDAEGVLPVCLGNATKLCGMLTDTSKVYRCTMVLGRTTDTQDASGKTVSQAPVTSTEDEVRAAVKGFIGQYDQIPPMYSAKKVNGKKLYELAREGKEWERAACPVEIYDISVDQLELPKAVLTVSCSKGTYIRTLCHDIGQKLGCGAYMEELLRLRVGQFVLDDALSLEEVERMRDVGCLKQALISVESVFSSLPCAKVTEAGERFLYNGNPLMPSNLSEPMQLCPHQQIRVQDSRGRFCALYRWDEEKGQYRPERMFLPGRVRELK